MRRREEEEGENGDEKIKGTSINRPEAAPNSN